MVSVESVSDGISSASSLSSTDGAIAVSWTLLSASIVSL